MKCDLSFYKNLSEESNVNSELWSAGTGGIAGLVIAGLTAIGVWKKVEGKQDRNVCDERHESVSRNFEEIKTDLRDGFKSIQERIDKLIMDK